jgi:hypothetical protein
MRDGTTTTPPHRPNGEDNNRDNDIARDDTQKNDNDLGNNVRDARHPMGGEASGRLKAIVVANADSADAEVKVAIFRRQCQANWTMLDNFNEAHNNQQQQRLGVRRLGGGEWGERGQLYRITM